MDLRKSGKARLFHGFPVAGLTLGEAGDAKGVGDHLDLLEAFGNQELCSVISCLEIVEEHFSDPFDAFDVTVDQDGGDPVVEKLLDSFLAAFAGSQDYAVDVVCVDGVEDVTEFLRVFVGAGEQGCVVVIFLGLVFDAAGDSCEEFVGHVRRNDGDGVGAPAAQ